MQNDTNIAPLVECHIPVEGENLVIEQSQKKTRRSKAELAILLAKARDVISSVECSVTVRQIYYQMVSALLVRNNASEYKNLDKFLVRWRNEGLLDCTDFIDRGRTVQERLGYAPSPMKAMVQEEIARLQGAEFFFLVDFSLILR